MCAITNGSASVNHFYNPIKNSDTIRPELVGSYGLSNINISVDGNIFTCSFTRENIVQNVNHYFNTDNPNEYYLLTAKGIIQDNSKIYFFNNYRISYFLSIINFN